MKINIEIKGKQITVEVNTGCRVFTYGLERRDDDCFSKVGHKDLDEIHDDGDLTDDQFEALEDIDLIDLYRAFTDIDEDGEEDAVIKVVGINSPSLDKETIGDKIDSFQRNTFDEVARDLTPHYTPQIEINGTMYAIIRDDGQLHEYDTHKEAMIEAERIRNIHQIKLTNPKEESNE